MNVELSGHLKAAQAVSVGTGPPLASSAWLPGLQTALPFCRRQVGRTEGLIVLGGSREA